MKHGYGTYTWASGQVFAGEWRNNEKVTGETLGLVPPPPPYLKSFIASQTRPSLSAPPSPTSMHPEAGKKGTGRTSSTVIRNTSHRSSNTHPRKPPATAFSSPTSPFGPSSSRHTVTPGPPIFKNRVGFRMEHGKHFDCAHKLYCGRNMGVENIPGSNGVCGPNRGPQCCDCLGITTSNEHTFITTNGSYKKANEWSMEGRDVVMEEDEDDSDIREAIRRSLSENVPVVPKVYLNRAGYRMFLGEQRGSTHLFYCSRWMGVDKIPGSDGQCGPNNGPQCADCYGAMADDSYRYISPDGTAKSAEYWMAEEGEENDLFLTEAIRRSQLDMQDEHMMITSDGQSQEVNANVVSSANSTNNSSEDMVDVIYGPPPKPPPIPPQFINTTTDPTTPMENASSTRPPTWFTVSPVQPKAPSSFTPVYRLAPSQKSSEDTLSNPVPIRIPTEE